MCKKSTCQNVGKIFTNAFYLLSSFKHWLFSEKESRQQEIVKYTNLPIVLCGIISAYEVEMIKKNFSDENKHSDMILKEPNSYGFFSDTANGDEQCDIRLIQLNSRFRSPENENILSFPL